MGVHRHRQNGPWLSFIFRAGVRFALNPINSINDMKRIRFNVVPLSQPEKQTTASALKDPFLKRASLGPTSDPADMEPPTIANRGFEPLDVMWVGFHVHQLLCGWFFVDIHSQMGVSQNGGVFCWLALKKKQQETTHLSGRLFGRECKWLVDINSQMMSTKGWVCLFLRLSFFGPSSFRETKKKPGLFWGNPPILSQPIHFEQRPTPRSLSSQLLGLLPELGAPPRQQHLATRRLAFRGSQPTRRFPWHLGELFEAKPKHSHRRYFLL